MQRDLRELGDVLADRTTVAMTRDLLSDVDSLEDELDEYWSLEYERVKAARYSGRNPSYGKRKARCKKMLFKADHTNDSGMADYWSS
ncbi:hypothetical protein DVH05_021665 [Phytophthora capsici]|nr:hypothetical protein DVH05_021665 [Phytophthora capsici]